jgi:hypothetical protein
MKKTISILLGVVLVLGLRLAVPGSMVAEDRIIHVPGDHPTIQEAIDAARDGDTISVASGEYGAFSVIGKNDISIVGAAGATVTAGHSFSINRGPIGDAWTMAAVKDSRSISIRGLAFDGTALGGLNGDYEVVAGIAYVDSTGRIANLTVENTIGMELGVGVAVIGHTGTRSVNLADVTVRNSMAGVIVWGAEADLDGCTIEDMRPNGGFGIMTSGVGIVAGIPGDDWQGPATVKVKGGSISNNNDIGIYVCDGSVVEAHFNNILGNALFGVLNVGGQIVDARYNWWGHADGPFPPAANAVSGGVDVVPWVGADVVTQTLTADGVVNARREASTEVWVTMRSTAAMTVDTLSTEAWEVIPTTVSVSKYQYNPEGAAPTQYVTLGKYVDVRAVNTGQVSSIEIRLYYTDAEVGNVSGLVQGFFRLLWWDGSLWQECSHSGVDTSARYIWAKISANTTPSLAEMGGTPFGGYGSSPGVPQGLCAIATAAYGTDKAQEIQILREFRDAVLLPNELGAAFVALYYRTSPAVAGFIFRYEILRATVRVGVIDRIVAVLNWSRAWWSVTGR